MPAYTNIEVDDAAERVESWNLRWMHSVLTIHLQGDVSVAIMVCKVRREKAGGRINAVDTSLAWVECQPCRSAALVCLGKGRTVTVQYGISALHTSESR
jgi:hypothetical protein